MFQGQLFHSNNYSISVSFTSSHNGDNWILTNVYGPSQQEERPLFIDWFKHFQTPEDSNWMVLGDFNHIRYPHNRNLEGRNIHDNYIYVRGIARALRQAKTPAMMIKLDIEKAFDTVSWELLLEVLQANGFGRKWLNWISNLLATQSTRVLINGQLSEPIIHRRGLRQGDPLSPLLFVIVLDCMATMFAKSSQVGILKPIGNQRLAYRTSLYADDAIIFINLDIQEMKAVQDMLDAFGTASGLRTNYGKSSLTPICCGGIYMEAIAGELGCPIKHFPCTYLGMPLSDCRITRADWQPALDKVYAR